MEGVRKTAVFSVSGMWDFYLHQARQLAAWRQLSINVLEHGGAPVAFEYGWRAKGVYSAAKVGYLERVAQFSPGQLLRYLLIEQLHAEGKIAWVDFLGPATSAISAWGTHQYSIDRLVASLGGPFSRLAVQGVARLGPLLRSVHRSGSRAACTLPRIGQPGARADAEFQLADVEGG